LYQTAKTHLFRWMLPRWSILHMIEDKEIL